MMVIYYIKQLHFYLTINVTEHYSWYACGKIYPTTLAWNLLITKCSEHTGKCYNSLQSGDIRNISHIHIRARAHTQRLSFIGVRYSLRLNAVASGVTARSISEYWWASYSNISVYSYQIKGTIIIPQIKYWSEIRLMFLARRYWYVCMDIIIILFSFSPAYLVERKTTLFPLYCCLLDKNGCFSNHHEFGAAFK